jgi:CRP/FNR family cyclic AMP-dependent transcriptional regulator
MIQVVDEQSYEDGEIIWEEGSFGDWFYVIDAGTVELSRKVKGEKLVIDVLKKDEIFGEIGYIIETPRLYTARAVGPTTLGIIDRETLDQEFNKLAPSFKVILKSLAMRLKKDSNNAVGGRRFPRMPKALSLVFKSKTSLVNAFSGNVSLGGLYIKTPKPLAKGEQFSLKLKLPEDPTPLNTKCEVVWSRSESSDPEQKPVGMGVKFIEISDADRQRLEKGLKNPAAL